MGRWARSIGFAAAICLGHAPDVLAKPTIWAAARRPNAAAREVLLEQAEKTLTDAALTKERLELYGGLPFGDSTEEAARIEARELLEKAGGATSPNMMVRLQYANLMRTLASDQKPRNLKNIEESARIVTTVLTSRPGPAMALTAWNELALSYALLGKREKEVQAYGETLKLEPMGVRRAMLLANRAESYMGLGQIDDAIAGYREALASLLYDEIRGYGVTTLWGLAVALDRNGDLEDGLQHIRLARTYDQFDERIKDDSWFYSPAYDEYWYAALGAWAKAREIKNSIDRTFEYGHALEAWEAYIRSAAPNDPYVALARVRYRACELERERASRQTPTP